MTENLNVNFEYCVDEAVAFQLEFLGTTKEGSSWRSREQWKFAISFVFVCVLVSRGAAAQQVVPRHRKAPAVSGVMRH